MKFKWTHELDARLREMWPSMPAADVAQQFGVSTAAVRTRARKVLSLPSQTQLGVRRERERRVLKLAPMEVAEGHFAVDPRSYEIWMRARSKNSMEEAA